MPEMSDAGKGILMEFFYHVTEGMFCDSVETGEIEIEGRDADEILASFFEGCLADYVRGRESGEFDFALAIDHRDTLLDKASSESADGSYAVATTLYATWLEHEVNGILRLAFERAGISHKTC